VQNGNLHNAKGLGLGLYFTKKVVTMHEGAIKVQSTPGEGTTFTVIIPMS
jgi:two-component system, OmpR family, phosphate regulon sensor histidine kinase PhoR